MIRNPVRLMLYILFSITIMKGSGQSSRSP